MDITQIIIAAIVGVIGLYLAPMVKAKISIELVNRIVFTAVYAAEQLNIRKAITDKFVYANERIKSALAKWHIKYNEAEITEAIEAAVRQNFPKG